VSSGTKEAGTPRGQTGKVIAWGALLGARNHGAPRGARAQEQPDKAKSRPTTTGTCKASQTLARMQNRITTLEAIREDVKKCLAANLIYGSMYLTQNRGKLRLFTWVVQMFKNPSRRNVLPMAGRNKLSTA
jgi:hypothetical protein